MAEEDPVNIRRREFEVLRQEVRDMKIELLEEANSPASKIVLLKRVAIAMGLNPGEVING